MSETDYIDSLNEKAAVELLDALSQRDRRRARARAYHARHAPKINKKRRARYLEQTMKLKELDRESARGDEE